MDVIDEQGRTEPPGAAGEIDSILGFLDYQRQTLEWRTRGLTDEQLRATLHPTTMTLGGLLKHLAFVEDYWFTHQVSGRLPAEPFRSVDWDADPDWDWNSAASDTGDQLRTLWSDAVERSRAIVEEALAAEGPAALDRTFTRGDQTLSVRWVLLHMIEEYARHNGHADLLRESIDGETGE